MISKIPIQPFDDRLRERIRRVIFDAFDEQYQLNKRRLSEPDPDTCGTAADRVIAVLVGELLGVEVTVTSPTDDTSSILVIDTSKPNEVL